MRKMKRTSVTLILGFALIFASLLCGCGEKKAKISEELAQKYENFKNEHDIEAVCSIAVNNLMAEGITDVLLNGSLTPGDYTYSVYLYDTDQILAQVSKKDVDTPPVESIVVLGFSKYYQVLTGDKLIPISYGIDIEHVTLKEGELTIPEADEVSFANFYNKTNIISNLRSFLYDRYMIHNPKDQSNWPNYYLSNQVETKEIRLLDIIEDQLEYKALVITEDDSKYLLNISKLKSGFAARGEEVPISDALYKLYQPVFEGHSAMILEKQQSIYDNVTTTTYVDVTRNYPMGDSSTLTDFGDLNGDGKNEFIVMDIYPWNLLNWSLYVDDKEVYQAENYNYCDFEARFIDLDEDEKEEILIIVHPHVNSAMLEEYVVLKNSDNGWIELDNTAKWSNNQDSNGVSNHFPINVLYGKEKNTFEITLEGFETFVTDITDHYQKVLDSAEDYPEREDDELIRNAKDILINGKYSAGDDVGGSPDWGIFNIDTGVFDGKNCLIASESISGPMSKWDYIGCLDIYFNYDNEGKIQILGAEFDDR